MPKVHIDQPSAPLINLVERQLGPEDEADLFENQDGGRDSPEPEAAAPLAPIGDCSISEDSEVISDFMSTIFY